jgi:hypothetical protein
MDGIYTQIEIILNNYVDYKTTNQYPCIDADNIPNITEEIRDFITDKFGV